MQTKASLKNTNYQTLASILFLVFINCCYILLTYFIFFHRALVSSFNHPEYAYESGSGMVGLAYWALSVFLCPFVVLASVATYYIIVRVFSLHKLHIVIALVVTVVITFIAANWVPIFSSVVTANQMSQYSGLNLQTQLSDEKIEKVNNTTQDRLYPYPHKYIYHFTLDIENSLNKTLPPFYIEESLATTLEINNCQNNLNCYRFVIFNAAPITYNLSLGHKLISSSFPIVFTNEAKITSKTKVMLMVNIYSLDGLWKKTYYFPSKINNWMEIYNRQSEFVKLYQRK